MAQHSTESTTVSPSQIDSYKYGCSTSTPHVTPLSSTNPPKQDPPSVGELSTAFEKRTAPNMRGAVVVRTRRALPGGSCCKKRTRHWTSRAVPRTPRLVRTLSPRVATRVETQSCRGASINVIFYCTWRLLSIFQSPHHAYRMLQGHLSRS